MKELKISKELIKAGLQKETETLSKDFNFIINEDYIEFSDDGEMQFEYCIYKFAFKCKEWAFANFYLSIIIFKVKDNVYKCEIANISDYLGEWTTKYSFRADSELDAMFKACEWILENKDNK